MKASGDEEGERREVLEKEKKEGNAAKFGSLEEKQKGNAAMFGSKRHACMHACKECNA